MSKPRWIVPLSSGFAIAAFALGIAGFEPVKGALSGDVGPDASGDRSVQIFNAIHATLQLYVLNYGASDMQHWSMRVAALLAPISLAGVAIATLWERLATGFLVSRLWFRGVDHLFIGTGARATAIAFSKTLKAPAGIRIGGLDLVGNPEFREQLERLQDGVRRIAVFVLEGDARSDLTLSLLNVGDARTIWITTADDALNLMLARKVAQLESRDERWPLLNRIGRRWRHLIRKHDRYDPPRIVLARVSHTRLVRADAALHGRSTSTEYFNLGRLVARAVYRTFPPYMPETEIVAGKRATIRLRRRPHIALCGDGDLIDSLAVVAAMHWILDLRPEYSIRITLIGSRARQTYRRLLGEHPALTSSGAGKDGSTDEYRTFADLVVHEVDSGDLDLKSWNALQSAVPFDAIYISGESDLLTARIAARCAALRDIGCCRVPESPPIVALLQEHLTMAGQPSHPALQAAGLHWFNIYHNLFDNDDAFPGQSLDREAILIDQVHERRGPDVAAGDGCADRWRSDISDDFKWSARYSAAHIDVKIGLLDVALREAGLGQTLQSAISTHLTFLSRLEHRRFVAERMINGWMRMDAEGHGGPFASAPSGKSKEDQKRDLRLNSNLIPYQRLERRYRRLDRNIVRSMPRIKNLDGEVMLGVGSAS